MKAYRLHFGELWLGKQYYPPFSLVVLAPTLKDAIQIGERQAARRTDTPRELVQTDRLYDVDVIWHP